MITRNTYPHNNTSVKVECTGLSTDRKPTNLPNGSVFYEMDTATTYMYDEQNKRWLAQ